METGNENNPILPSKRSDIALTQDIVGAIVEKLKCGENITKRGSKYLILNYKDGQEPVSVSTYTSWLRRDTTALNSKDNKSLKECVDEARLEYKNQLRQEMLDKAEQVLFENLHMKTTEKTLQKRTNKDGKLEFKNANRIVPKLVEVKQRSAEFIARKLEPQVYGDKLETKNQHAIFDLSALRRYKEEMERDEEV